MNQRQIKPLALSVLLLLCACGARRAAVDVSAPPSSSVRAYLDPASGKLREPTAQELAAQGQSPPGAIVPEASRRDTAATGSHQAGIEFAVPGGGFGMRPARPLSTEEHACVTADGQLQRDCSSTEARP